MMATGTAQVPLRRRLLLLTGAAIVPLAVMSGVGLYALAQPQRVQAERVGLELARAVANAVDAELRSGISALESLATTPTLDRDDDAAFRARALRFLDTQPHWVAVMLADPSGTRRFDTRYGPAVQLPPLAERGSFDRVVQARAPALGSLASSPEGVLLFPVRVPVLRNGELRYVLSAIVKPAQIRDVVTRQGVPDDWVISGFEGRRTRRGAPR
jgi:hypothetical protein